jgi:hypothetical protein
MQCDNEYCVSSNSIHLGMKRQRQDARDSRGRVSSGHKMYGSDAFVKRWKSN